MAAMSLVERELSDRLNEVVARLSKLEENHGAEKSGGSGTLSARVKSVEGQITDLSARLDAIEGDPQGLTAKTPTKSTTVTKK